MVRFTRRFFLASHSRLGFSLMMLSGLFLAQGGCEEPDADSDGWTVAQGDCNDRDVSVYPGAEEACDGLDNDCDALIDNPADEDGDGYLLCAQGELPADCDDTRSDVYPGAEEFCDGSDGNCNGAVDDAPDVDGDGYGPCALEDTFADCDDTDIEVYPGAEEPCNGIDNDCDGTPDNPPDGDGDGYLICAQPEAAEDCDDQDAETYPGAEEPCNGIDNDCDGTLDNPPDGDGDGYLLCAQPEAAEDCDDQDAETYPGAEEVCNSADSDCDGTLDNPADGDGDGYLRCVQGETEADCDDTRSDVYPGAEETCDGVDEDCNGILDDGFEDVTYYLDEDGDGYGLNDATVQACVVPDSHSAVGGDCDDQNVDIHPGAEEDCNGLDDNCDGQTDESPDADGDGFHVCATEETPADCDDDDPAINPDAEEVCEEIGSDPRDNDCNGLIDDVGDEDADGFTLCEQDCDDTDPYRYPGAEERCDEKDNDCDQEVDEGLTEASWRVDDDGSAAVPDGQSWATAFRHPQDAADAALASGVDCNTLWVAEGTYHGLEAEVPVLAMFVGMEVYGGFSGEEEVFEERAGLFEETIFNGDFDGDGAGSAGDAHPVVSLSSASDTVLDGLRITGGYLPEEWNDTKGGGIRIYNSAPVALRQLLVDGNQAEKGGGLAIEFSRVRLEGVTFRGNTAYYTGGGLWGNAIGALGIEIQNCLFEDNHAVGSGDEVFYDDTGGGGLSLTGPLEAARVESTRFIGNSSAGLGGGFSCILCELELRSVQFEANESGSAGGAIYQYCDDETLTGEDLLFTDNETGNNGGGWYSYHCSNRLNDVTFVGNRAARSGGGLYNISSQELYATDLRMISNVASTGGALYLSGQSNYVLNSEFIDNTASTGGAIYIRDGTDVQGYLGNLSFSGNQASYGGAIFASGSGDEHTTLFNTIFWDNHASYQNMIYESGELFLEISHSCLQQEHDADLSFVLSDSPFDVFDHDEDGLLEYYLRQDSACIDLGSTELATATALGVGLPPDWWSVMTTSSQQERDMEGIDAGVHYDVVGITLD